MHERPDSGVAERGGETHGAVSPHTLARVRALTATRAGTAQGVERALALYCLSLQVGVGEEDAHQRRRRRGADRKRRS